jgi:hypothetical protein
MKLSIRGRFGALTILWRTGGMAEVRRTQQASRKVIAKMPHYFFHFLGWVNADDDVGADFCDDRDAYAYARRVAWELARNATSVDNRGARILVMDDAGRELFAVALEGSTDLS